MQPVGLLIDVLEKLPRGGRLERRAVPQQRARRPLDRRQRRAQLVRQNREQLVDRRRERQRREPSTAGLNEAVVASSDRRPLARLIPTGAAVLRPSLSRSIDGTLIYRRIDGSPCRGAVNRHRWTIVIDQTNVKIERKSALPTCRGSRAAGPRAPPRLTPPHGVSTLARAGDLMHALHPRAPPSAIEQLDLAPARPGRGLVVAIRTARAFGTASNRVVSVWPSEVGPTKVCIPRNCPSVVQTQISWNGDRGLVLGGDQLDGCQRPGCARSISIQVGAALPR